ncbi:MAG: PspC domain-containing protein [Microbacter sp.]
MKKTISMNLNGSVFQIDEDAFEVLRQYLDAVSDHLHNEPGQKEIMNDIEARIAELLLERIHRSGQVVTVEMVEEIIQVMGHPSDYGEETEASADSSTEAPKESHKPHRRLYRDPENAFLAGILSGLAIYLNMDVVWLRILFVILVLLGVGTIIPIYLVLWLVIPRAETTAQRLEMRGIDVTIENLKAEAAQMKDRFQKYVNSESLDKKKQQMSAEAKRMKEKVETFARSSEVNAGKHRGNNVLQGVLKTILAIIAGLVGFVGAVIVFALFIVLIVAIAAPSWLVLNVPDGLQTVSVLWASNAHLIFTLLALLFFIGVPVYMLFYAAVQMMSGQSSLSSRSKWAAFILWLIAFLVLIGLSFNIFLVHGGWCWM